MSELNINPKIYPIGSVVYFIKKYGHEWEVSYGIVEEHYVDTICLQLYELLDTRLINGIPIKDFITPTRWHKLPKGWSYDTKLFEITYGEYPHDPKDYNLKNPNDILKAIEDGILVKVQDNDHARIRDEIDSKLGWRICREYPIYEHHPTYTSIRYYDVYGSYNEAMKVIHEHDAEFKRQSELSDYDWSVEQIDKELNRWAYMYSISVEEKQRYREWILSLDKVEDVEIRILQGTIQWKYCKNKRWMNIEI
ncbi:MAG: hypothetical protein Q4D76_20295 [Oscillospiraceae bacterium]|nr:hypothetical protein [Oscillospiraceae bacterium]